ncbi:hypothetical protein [Gordonia insulae]|uniref:Uncharacterized protein n=1 Tax=Gordonia insulae TaxID=2420509 RepID=A0A3G8JH63_9ACTN|nr:hypothetical protein [Gordonia insulae]AZG43590.1 hypothetical protein D7316_00159 [Gordonia insulae]
MKKRPQGDALQVQLIHVDLQRMLCERLDDGDDPLPTWMTQTTESNGVVSVESFDDESHVACSLSVSMQKDLVCVNVKLVGLYQINPESSVLTSGDTLFERIPEDYQRGLARQGLEDLYPFVRQAVHEASVRVRPIAGILLTPQPPELGTPVRNITPQ